MVEICMVAESTPASLALSDPDELRYRLNVNHGRLIGDGSQYLAKLSWYIAHPIPLEQDMRA